MVSAVVKKKDPNLASDRKALYDQLVGQGAEPKEAIKFSGYEPPASPESSSTSSSTKPLRESKGSARPVTEGRRFVTSSGARKTIFGVMAFSLAIGIIRDVSSGRAVTSDVIPRRVIGTFIGTFLLMVLAGPLPQVAKGLAFLVGFTVIAFNTETIALIGSRTGTGSARSRSDDVRPAPVPGEGVQDRNIRTGR